MSRKYSLKEAQAIIKSHQHLIGKEMLIDGRNIIIEYLAAVPEEKIDKFFSKLNSTNEKQEFIDNYQHDEREEVSILLIGYTPLSRRWYRHLDDYLKEQER
jgi:hypothetical protein